MKKLILCCALFMALVSIVVGRSRTGSAGLTSNEAASMAVDALAEYARPIEHRLSIDLRRQAWLDYLAAKVLEPGAYLVTRLGVLPRSRVPLAVTVVASWWIWLTAARLPWMILGRRVGVAGIGQYRFWLALTPPWRPLFRLWLVVVFWYRQLIYDQGPSAGWMGPLSAMCRPYRQGESVFLGRLTVAGFGLYQPIGIEGSGHVAVVAAPGAGKTRWLMAWLGDLHRDASAFVVDVDGQIINALGPALERSGHRVINLDPYNLNDFPGACWNALDEITAAVKRHGRKAAVRYAATLAEALIREDNSHQPVFANGARTFIHGLTLYSWLFEPAERRNLVRVRELLTQGLPELVVNPKQDAFDVLLRRMTEAVRYDDGCEGMICAVIARAASVMKSGKGRDGNPFRTTAMAQTAWLDLPEIASVVMRSDFVGEDLKTGNPCVFVCAPVVDIQTKLSGFVRALTMMTLYAFQNIKKKRKIPCAFLIDEFPSLGRIEILETAAPVFRKYGVRLVIVTQNIERLRQAYPHSYGGFIGDAAATVWMSTNHQETLESLSKHLGNTTRTHKVVGGLLSKIAARLDRREQSLMQPEQLHEYLGPGRNRIIVSGYGKPMKVAYEGYDFALPVWAYEHDRHYRQPVLRAMTRYALNWLRARKAPKGVEMPQAGNAPSRSSVQHR